MLNIDWSINESEIKQHIKDEFNHLNDVQVNKVVEAFQEFYKKDNGQVVTALEEKISEGLTEMLEDIISEVNEDIA